MLITYRICKKHIRMITKIQLRNGLKSLDLSEQVIDSIYEKILVDEEVTNIFTTPGRYLLDDQELLASCATSINNLQELSEGDNSVLHSYFKHRYKKWTSLVLETEDGDIYEYTKHNIIMSYRGLQVHKNKGSTKKQEYLHDFLKNRVKPNVLFVDIGHIFRCVYDENHSKLVKDDCFKVNLTFNYKFDIKEALLFAVVKDIQAVTQKKNLSKEVKKFSRNVDYLESKNKAIAEKIKKQIREIEENRKEA